MATQINVRDIQTGRVGYLHMTDPDKKRYSVVFPNEQPPTEEWFDEGQLEFL